MKLRLIPSPLAREFAILLKEHGSWPSSFVAGNGNPYRKISGAEAVGRSGHLPQRFDQPVGKGPHYTERDRQRSSRGAQEDFKGLSLVSRHCSGTGSREHSAYTDPVFRMHGHPDGQVIALVHAAQCPRVSLQALAA